MKKIGGILVFYNQTTFAQSISNKIIETNASTELIKVMLGLLLVVAVIFVLSYVVKKINGVSFAGNSQFFKVISALALGTKDKIVLVKTGDNYLLLGISSNGITKLHEYEKLTIEEDTKTGLDFSSLLNKMKNNESKN